MIAYYSYGNLLGLDSVFSGTLLSNSFFLTEPYYPIQTQTHYYYYYYYYYKVLRKAYLAILALDSS